MHYSRLKDRQVSKFIFDNTPSINFDSPPKVYIFLSSATVMIFHTTHHATLYSPRKAIFILVSKLVSKLNSSFAFLIK